MGADGGSVAKRSDLVSSAHLQTPKAQIVDANRDAWRRCALSGELLADPVVSDWNGALYNKTAILRYLLGSAPSASRPKTRIAQIRDVVELSRELVDGKWVDRITRKALEDEGTSERFGYIAECGHVSSYLILSQASCCPICEHTYEDTVILNPQTPDAEAHNQRRFDKLETLGLSNSLRPKRRKGAKRSAEKHGHVEDSPALKSRRVS